MVISADDLKLELLQIIRCLRVPVDGKLTHALLINEWAKTHLRKKDLDLATEYLIADAILNTGALAEGEPSYQLTQHGYSRVMEFGRHPFNNMMRKIRISFMLGLMRNNYSLGAYRRNAD